MNQSTMTQIEHANITVPSIDSAIPFLQIVAPDFRVKADVTPEGKHRWAHIGNDNNYLALQEPNIGHVAEDKRNPYLDIGFNHLALIVHDIETIKTQLLAKGYEINGDLTHEPYRKRVYFWDAAGFEWELVEYFTQDPDFRYHYG